MAFAMKSLLVLLLFVSAVVCVSKRSARWDAHLDQLHQRSKRQAQTPGCNWQRKGTVCNVPAAMANDALRRRASGLLAPVESQGCCGSCWAFSATHTFTDARSIRAGSRTPPLSPHYLASCSNNPNGCCGGNKIAGLLWFRDTGTVTKSCAPYSLMGYIYRKGASNSLQGFCPRTCTDGTVFNPSAIRLDNVGGLSESQVMGALASGPVAATIHISTNFRDRYGGCVIFCQERGDT